jgi:hypothetical protein
MRIQLTQLPDFKTPSGHISTRPMAEPFEYVHGRQEALLLWFSHPPYHHRSIGKQEDFSLRRCGVELALRLFRRSILCSELFSQFWNSQKVPGSRMGIISRFPLILCSGGRRVINVWGIDDLVYQFRICVICTLPSNEELHQVVHSVRTVDSSQSEVESSRFTSNTLRLHTP